MHISLRGVDNLEWSTTLTSSRAALQQGERCSTDNRPSACRRLRCPGLKKKLRTLNKCPATEVCGSQPQRGGRMLTVAAQGSDVATGATSVSRHTATDFMVRIQVNPAGSMSTMHVGIPRQRGPA